MIKGAKVTLGWRPRTVSRRARKTERQYGALTAQVRALAAGNAPISVALFPPAERRRVSDVLQTLCNNGEIVRLSVGRRGRPSVYAPAGEGGRT